MDNASERHAPNLTLRGSLGTMLAKMRHSCQSILLAGVLMLAGGSAALAGSPASSEHMRETGIVVDVGSVLNINGYCTDPQAMYSILKASRDEGNSGFVRAKSVALSSGDCMTVPQSVPITVSAVVVRVTVKEATHSMAMIQFTWSGVEYYSYVIHPIKKGELI